MHRKRNESDFSHAPDSLIASFSIDASITTPHKEKTPTSNYTASQPEIMRIPNTPLKAIDPSKMISSPGKTLADSPRENKENSQRPPDANGHERRAS